MKVGVGVFLFSHHGEESDVWKVEDKKVWKVAETIKEAIKKRAPYTFFLTSYTLNAMAKIRPDVVEMIKWDTANILTGWDPKKVEIGISTSHHMPVVQPGLPLEYWGAYLEGFVKEQIGISKQILENTYHRTPRSFFPPEAMFSPDFIYLLQEMGIYCTIMSAEFLGDDRWAKGQVYHQSPDFRLGDTKIVARVNDINLDDAAQIDAWKTKERIKDYAASNNIERVVLGCDVDLYAGNRELSLKDGIARMCCLYDAISSDPEMYMVNVASIADGYHVPRNIYHLYAEHGIVDPQHHISSWMDGKGSLDKLDPYINGLANEFIIHHTNLWNKGKGCEKMQHAKEKFFYASGMEFRNKDWSGGLRGTFDANYGPARQMLYDVGPRQ